MPKSITTDAREARDVDFANADGRTFPVSFGTPARSTVIARLRNVRETNVPERLREGVVARKTIIAETLTHANNTFPRHRSAPPAICGRNGIARDRTALLLWNDGTLVHGIREQIPKRKEQIENSISFMFRHF